MQFNNLSLSFLLHASASFGGIFGLCLGGSVISLVELIYFFSLRLYSIVIDRSAGGGRAVESKRVSISNSVKTLELNPKSFFSHMKSYQQNERFGKLNKLKPTARGSLFGKSSIQEFNKPGVQEFLP